MVPEEPSVAKSEKWSSLPSAGALLAAQWSVAWCKALLVVPVRTRSNLRKFLRIQLLNHWHKELDFPVVGNQPR
jgi:hypothetical protein